MYNFEYQLLSYSDISKQAYKLQNMLFILPASQN